MKEMRGITREDERDCWHEKVIFKEKNCQEPIG
jgi:hypothetical protein